MRPDFPSPVCPVPPVLARLLLAETETCGQTTTGHSLVAALLRQLLRLDCVSLEAAEYLTADLDVWRRSYQTAVWKQKLWASLVLPLQRELAAKQSAQAAGPLLLAVCGLVHSMPEAVVTANCGAICSLCIQALSLGAGASASSDLSGELAARLKVGDLFDLLVKRFILFSTHSHSRC